MMIRARIVSGECVLRDRIQLLLETEPDIEIVAEDAGALARNGFVEPTPDVVIVGGEAPAEDDLGSLCALVEERRTSTIVSFSADWSATRGREHWTLTLLLNPFSAARFAQALQLVRRHLGGSDAVRIDQPRSRRFLSHLTVKEKDRILVLEVGNIDAIESAGNYVAVHQEKQSYILRQTLTSLETELNPRKFLRVSRSAIVRLDRVKELHPMFRGQHVAVLHDGRRVTVTRSLRDVEAALKFT